MADDDFKTLVTQSIFTMADDDFKTLVLRALAAALDALDKVEQAENVYHARMTVLTDIRKALGDVDSR